MNAFVDGHRARYGVEPICSALQVAPSAYRRHAARQRNPALLSARARRDAQLLPEVQRVYDQNLQVYGADKLWRQLHREGLGVARCTVERLMRQAGLRGVRRGKAVRTTVPDAKAACPLDRVRRQFTADRRLEFRQRVVIIPSHLIQGCHALGQSALFVDHFEYREISRGVCRADRP